MKQLTCEMCGSTDIAKQDGFFVCQTCGMKYSVEDAKKMMIEGTVEVKGSVKIDSSDNLEKLYQLARRAKEGEDSETAIKYYEMILLEKPNDWEAAFYKLLFATRNCTLGQMEERIYTFSNNIESIFKLVDLDEVQDEDEKKLIYKQIKLEIMKLYNLYLDNYLKRAKGYSDWTTGKEHFREWIDSLIYMAIIVGDCFYKYAKDQEEAYYFYVTYAVDNCENSTGKHKAIAIDRAKIINPEYVYEDTKSQGGCYVATCVYGSYDCPQVWTLRRYRDDTLGSTWCGRLFIRTYYAISPTLVKWFGNTNWFKKLWKGTLDRMVAKLQAEGVENTPYEDKKW